MPGTRASLRDWGELLTRTVVKPAFNLLTEPWLPVVDSKGKAHELGLLQLLQRAREFGGIAHEDPLVVVALHRFLLAFLHRALEGPQEVEEACDWMEDGFPFETIRAYADKWKHRFDLFDDKRPFGQHPELNQEKFIDHWSRLQAARGSFNTNFLYSYELRNKTDNEDATKAAEAARQLLAHQHFALGGLTKRFVTSAKSSPFATACLTLVMGNNLLETLCLNMVGYDRKHGQDCDLAIWEQDPPLSSDLKKGKKRAAAGLSDHYTWAARSVLFRPDEDGRVTTMYYAEGLSPVDNSYHDPMVCQIQNRKGEWYPLSYREGRALWRDLNSFVPSEDGETNPDVINWAFRVLSYADRFDESLTFASIGIVNNKAKISQTRLELLRLPALALKAPTLQATLKEWTAEAGEEAYLLSTGLKALAGSLLSNKRNGAAPRDVSALVNSFQFEARFWPRAEELFWEQLDSLPTEIDEFQNSEPSLHEHWCKKLRSLKMGVYDDICSSLEPTPQTLRAICKGRTALWRGNKKS